MPAALSVNDAVAPSSPTRKLRLPRLPAGVRLPGDRASFYPPSGDRRADLWWQAQVVRLTGSGLAILLGRRFEAGTVLELDLAGAASAAGSSFLIRVRDVRAGETGGWAHDCAFAQPLSEEELRGLG